MNSYNIISKYELDRYVEMQSFQYSKFNLDEFTRLFNIDIGLLNSKLREKIVHAKLGENRELVMELISCLKLSR